MSLTLSFHLCVLLGNTHHIVASTSQADKERERALYLEETKGKRAERKKIRDLRSQLAELRREQRQRHVELLDGYDSDDDDHYVIREITIETILSSKDEVV